MKNFFTFLLILTAFASANAQYWQIPTLYAEQNPGNLNLDPEYPVGGGLPTTWVTVHTYSTTPKWSGIKILPFNFKFNGVTSNAFKISNSGVVTFDTATTLAAPGFTRVALPNPNVPNNSVCILGLGGIGTNDNVVAKTFGQAPNRQYWLQFSSYGYGTTTSDGTNFTYWSIVFEETSNKIYVVDNRSGGYTAATRKVSIGIQTDNATAFVVEGSPDVSALAGTDPTPVDNTYYAFVPGIQNKYDMISTKIVTSQFQIKGDVVLRAEVRNHGTETIKSMDVNWQTKGGIVQTASLTGLNIAPLDYYEFDHPTPWGANTGKDTITMWASNLNGNDDQNPSDDKTAKIFSILIEKEQRVPLFEIFTSSTCPPCKPGNENLHSIIDTKPVSEFAVIKYQQNFPGTGDPYATTESINRRSTYYAINSIPRMEIDGGWNSNAQAFTESLYAASLRVPASYKLNGDYLLEGQKVSVKVRYSPLYDGATGTRLYIAILEKHTTSNVKTNGETEFHQVMKKMVPTETGTALSSTVAPGAWDSLSVSYTFNGSYRLPLDGTTANIIKHATENSVEDFANLYVIAWIQSADKFIHQAANLKDLSTGVVNVSPVLEEINVFPNPTSDVLNVQIKSEVSGKVMLTMVDLDGSVVYAKEVEVQSGSQTITLPTDNLINGLYNLMLIDEHNNSSVHQVVIMK